MTPEPYRLRLTARVRRQIDGPPHGLPAGVAAAAVEFVTGPLLVSPWRVGKPLRDPYEGQHAARCGPGHRIRYVIDPAAGVVTVIDIASRADAYGRD